MGEGLVTGKRCTPVGTQHGNSARWVEEWNRVYGTDPIYSSTNLGTAAWQSHSGLNGSTRVTLYIVALHIVYTRYRMTLEGGKEAFAMRQDVPAALCRAVIEGIGPHLA